MHMGLTSNECGRFVYHCCAFSHRGRRMPVLSGWFGGADGPGNFQLTQDYVTHTLFAGPAPGGTPCDGLHGAECCRMLVADRRPDLVFRD